MVTVENSLGDHDLDKKIKEHQDRLAFEERLKQEKKREEVRRMQEDMKHRLDLQVQEKRVREQSERIANEDHHKTMVYKVHQEEMNDKQKEEHKIKLK